MGLFDRLRSTGQTAANSSGHKADTSEQDATRLIEAGHVLEASNRLDESMQCYLDAIRVAPNPARAYLNQGNVLLLKGDLLGALEAFRTAIKHKPDYAGAYYNIGNALQGNKQFDEAVVNYRRALEFQPDYAEVHCALGVALKDLGQYEDAVASSQRALKLNPSLFEAHLNMGNAMLNLGQYDGAIASYRRALEIDPVYTDARSNLLFHLNYTTNFALTYHLEQARQFGQIVAGKAGSRFSAWQCAPQPERLRVGLVSGDFMSHPVGFFLEGLLAHIDPAYIELIAYPTYHQEDALTARIRPHFSAWKPLFGKSDKAAAQLIHADGAHVLIDLSGHTAHNRLPLFAWKPAPIQVSWLGYFATTGVAEMDYLLADAMGVPEDQQGQFTESVWYLPDTRLCFTVPNVAIPVTPLPALSNGRITFGCFQNLPKVTDEVLVAWGNIFAALPDARLRMQCNQLSDSAQAVQQLQRLQRYGIESTRVSLHGSAPREAYLAAHADVDIILDTFPYPGGTTTCEALWMGVPTLTLAGDRLLARQGASLLMAAGLKEWIATSQEEYIAKAIALASDLTKLAVLRASLRQQVLASPLFDAPRFARNLEQSLWEMWLRYCDSTAAMKQ